MHDPVLDAVATTLSECGFGTVRFNFRGVGDSDGAFEGGSGETEDLKAVLDYVRREFEPTQTVGRRLFIWSLRCAAGGSDGCRTIDSDCSSFRR